MSHLELEAPTKMVKMYKLKKKKKVQTPSYRSIRDVMYNQINIINIAICYMWKLLRVLKENFFFYFLNLVSV